MKLAADCLDRMATTTQALHAALAADDHVLAWAVPLIALVVAVLLAPWVLHAYSRRVQRYMGFRELCPPPSAWWARRAQRSGGAAQALAQQTARAEPAPPLAAAVAARTRRLRWATVAAALTVWTGDLLLVLRDPSSTLGAGLGQLLFVAVMLAGLAQVHLQPEGSKRWLLGVALALVLPQLALEQDVSTENLLAGGFVVGLLYVVGAHRTWRVLCLPLTVGVMGAALGVLAAAHALVPAVCLPPSEVADALQNTAVLAILLGCLMAFVATMWGSGRVLSGLAWMMRRGWVSDLSLVSGAGTVLLVGLLLLGWEDASVPPSHKAVVGLIWLASAAFAYALVLMRWPAPHHGRSLLMLRVFSKDRRAEQLLDALQSRWRLAGPVLEIGGPDLAHLNLDLGEFIHFATGRTHELFQPGVVPAEVLAQSLQLTPDHEGRFRVNEVFCFDSAWRGVVVQMMQLADGVLLDLRGFNSTRSGTTFEVERLAALGLLPRVVAVYDAHTDWAWFEARVAATSPGPVPPLALRVEASAPDALPQCLAQLLALSDAPRPR